MGNNNSDSDNNMSFIWINLFYSADVCNKARIAILVCAQKWTQK